MPQPAQQVLCIAVIGLEIGAADLQVDRRRRTEIQDLADDVGGQEREGDAGEARRQFLAQLAYIVRGRPVIFVELDLNVAVLSADGA